MSRFLRNCMVPDIEGWGAALGREGPIFVIESANPGHMVSFAVGRRRDGTISEDFTHSGSVDGYGHWIVQLTNAGDTYLHAGDTSRGLEERTGQGSHVARHIATPCLDDVETGQTFIIAHGDIDKSVTVRVRAATVDDYRLIIHQGGTTRRLTVPKGAVSDGVLGMVGYLNEILVTNASRLRQDYYLYVDSAPYIAISDTEGRNGYVSFGGFECVDEDEDGNSEYIATGGLRYGFTTRYFEIYCTSSGEINVRNLLAEVQQRYNNWDNLPSGTNTFPENLAGLHPGKAMLMVVQTREGFYPAVAAATDSGSVSLSYNYAMSPVDTGCGTFTSALRWMTNVVPRSPGGSVPSVPPVVVFVPPNEIPLTPSILLRWVERNVPEAPTKESERDLLMGIARHHTALRAVTKAFRDGDYSGADSQVEEAHRALGDSWNNISVVGEKHRRTEGLPPQARFFKYLKSCLKNDFEGGALMRDTGRLRLFTKPIILTHRDMTVELGTFMVELYKTGRVLAVTVQPHENNTQSRGNSYWHPHVSSRGDVCWGMQQGTYQECQKRWLVDDMIDTLMGVLNQYNPDSPFRELKYWFSATCECCQEQVEDVLEECAGDECSDQVCSSCASKCRTCEKRRCRTCRTQEGWGSIGLRLYCTDCAVKCACCNTFTRRPSYTCTKCDTPVCEGCRRGQVCLTCYGSRYDGVPERPVCEAAACSKWFKRDDYLSGERCCPKCRTRIRPLEVPPRTVEVVVDEGQAVLGRAMEDSVDGVVSFAATGPEVVTGSVDESSVSYSWRTFQGVTAAGDPVIVSEMPDPATPAGRTWFEEAERVLTQPPMTPHTVLAMDHDEAEPADADEDDYEPSDDTYPSEGD